MGKKELREKLVNYLLLEREKVRNKWDKIWTKYLNLWPKFDDTSVLVSFIFLFLVQYLWEWNIEPRTSKEEDHTNNY